jgi:hypothetical protein
MKDLLFDLRGHLVRMIMWHRTGDKQAGITLVCKGFAPSIKARPSNPEIPTCLADITVSVGMLQTPTSTLYLSLIAVH